MRFWLPGQSLLQCCSMADWRQIQARIRKAKAGTDAAVKLTELYERTRDAMVAFELAQWQEKAGEHAEAARWYTAAAERFRRSQWRTKAEAALARLSAPAAVRVESTEESKLEDTPEAGISPSVEARPTEMLGAQLEARDRTAPEARGEREGHKIEGTPAEDADQSTETRGKPREGIEGAAVERTGVVRKSPHRRGRRGGRNRRSAGGTTSKARTLPPQSPSEAPVVQSPPPQLSEVAPMPAQSVLESRAPEESAAAPAFAVAAWRGRSRAGEPALASRMAHLESQLRRLLACPQVQLDLGESAPAGPGVLLLSDSDQVTHYYIESCQTLRIAIGNLIRGGRAAKDAPRLKERLAENLGIAESRVVSYLKEHCAVRWLQLDEGASELAHFAIAVLRPAVNE